MRVLKLLVLLSPIVLAACGSETDKKTVVVNPEPGTATVVTPNGDAHTCPTTAPC